MPDRKRFEFEYRPACTSSKYRPSDLTVSSVQSLFISSTPSKVIETLVLSSCQTENDSNSSTDQPAPAPSIVLPSFRKSVEATTLASCAGLRNGIGLTQVPSLILDV